MAALINMKRGYVSRRYRHQSSIDHLKFANELLA